MERNKGELLLAANFGPLASMANLRPQDYANYLKMISALNKNISDPQFHVAISAKAKSYDKHSLTEIGVAWLNEMGYGKQPFLIVFHKDTGNNHVHIVTTRVDRDGRKIPSDFEKRRAVQSIKKVLGYDFALQYKFSTRAQFFMLLESEGYPGIDPDELQLTSRINQYKPDKNRAAEIKELLMSNKRHADLISILKEKYQLELIFHASEGKPLYGYTIIDHQYKNVFKGSEVYPLKELMQPDKLLSESVKADQAEEAAQPLTNNIRSIWIADDVDDQQIHGMKRRRQKKARTNTR